MKRIVFDKVQSSPGHPRPLFFSNTPIFPKLSIGRPDDRYEQEADEMAERITQIPIAPSGKEPLAFSAGADHSNTQVPNIQCDWRDDLRDLYSRGRRTGRRIYQRGREYYQQGREMAGRARERAEEEAGSAAEELEAWWNEGTGDTTKIEFDGSEVRVIGTDPFSAPGISGLMAGNPGITSAGLPPGTDCTQPQYQHLPNVGPIPEGDYYVNPSEVESSPPARFNRSAWGRIRTRLHESMTTSLSRRAFTERTGGFFIHEDANHNGTAGCIGLTNHRDNQEVQDRIRTNSSRIPVEVRYPAAAPSGSTADAESDQPQVQAKSFTKATSKPSEIRDRTPFFSPDFSKQLRETSFNGQALPAPTKDRMSQAFRVDFKQVRIHTGPAATHLNRQLQAKAFTHGRDIYFNQGHYQPETTEGRKLLAHELTHVVQQTQAGPVPQIQRVELTYDDGPDSAGHTQAVVDALNQAGARATFYVVGQRVLEGNNWQTIFNIAAGGHWLGNHAFDWNNARDNHVFMHGTMEERALKILETEFAIRAALERGKQEAQQTGRWNGIPQANRDYIDDVIARGTGRFRTPGFRSHVYSPGGITQQAAIELANQVASAAGLRSFLASDSVDVDPEDWRSGRTADQVVEGVRSGVDENTDSILLHSRLAATAAATPRIVGDLQSRGFSFDEPARGAVARRIPRPGFAGLSNISDPPTPEQLLQARRFLMSNLNLGPVLMGSTAIGILQMAQAAGAQEVNQFLDFLETTPGPPGTGYMANFLLQNASFRLAYLTNVYWLRRRPLPADYQAGGRPAGP